MNVVLICGSRNWTNLEPIRNVISKLPVKSIIIHGGQQGADSIAGQEASKLGHDVMKLEVDWERFGRRAGPIRNQEMLNRLLSASETFHLPVKAFAFHSSPKLGLGTKDMVTRCIKHKIRVGVFLSCESEIIRASGDVNCKQCGMQYWRHPDLISILDSEGHPFLKLSCDGLCLKL